MGVEQIKLELSFSTGALPMSLRQHLLARLACRDRDGVDIRHADR